MMRQGYAVALVFVALALHAALVFGYLLQEGRLAIVPIYDDVAYFIDAFPRMAVLQAEGLRGFLYNWIVSPPHGPLTALSVTMGLQLTGGAIEGAYIANFVWLALFAGLIWVALDQHGPSVRAGIILALLPTPFLSFIVSEARPDPLWCLLLASGLAFAASINLAASRTKTVFAAGLLFGFAALAKPSALPAPTHHAL